MRDLDTADFFHSLFALFLLFEELAFTRNVAAVTFGDDVLTHCLDRFASNDLVADGGLDGDLKHLPRDEFLHFCRQEAAFCGGGVGVQDERKGIDRLVGNENVELDQLAHFVAGQMIVERGIAF